MGRTKSGYGFHGSGYYLNMDKSIYKKRHLKIIEYIYREWGSCFHFVKTKSGSLLIQLAPIDKHYFHLLITNYASQTSESINNIGNRVVEDMYENLYGIQLGGNNGSI